MAERDTDRERSLSSHELQSFVVSLYGELAKKEDFDQIEAWQRKPEDLLKAVLVGMDILSAAAHSNAAHLKATLQTQATAYPDRVAVLAGVLKLSVLASYYIASTLDTAIEPGLIFTPPPPPGKSNGGLLH
jgi:hypothetical protein